jgi:hypothetical protein
MPGLIVSAFVKDRWHHVATCSTYSQFYHISSTSKSRTSPKVNSRGLPKVERRRCLSHANFPNRASKRSLLLVFDARGAKMTLCCSIHWTKWSFGRSPNNSIFIQISQFDDKTWRIRALTSLVLIQPRPFYYAPFSCAQIMLTLVNTRWSFKGCFSLGRMSGRGA